MCNLFNGTYDSLTDLELIGMVRNNDNEAYRVLLSRYSVMLNNIVKKYASEFDIDDLMQEASLSFYYAAQFFDFQSSSFKTFSKVCVERGVMTTVRKSSAKKRIPESLIIPLDEELVNHSDNPESLFLRRESHELVLKEIGEKLSELELSVLQSFLKTGSYEQSAKELSLSKKSVDNALLRVRKKLDSLKSAN